MGWWWWEPKNTTSSLGDGASDNAQEELLPDSPHSSTAQIQEVPPNTEIEEPESEQISTRESDPPADGIPEVQSTIDEGTVRAEVTPTESSTSRYWIPSWIGPAPSISKIQGAPVREIESVKELDYKVSTEDTGKTTSWGVWNRSNEALKQEHPSAEESESSLLDGTPATSQSGSPSKDAKEQPNLLFPDFDACFAPPLQSPSFLLRLWYLFAPSKHDPRASLSLKPPATIRRAVCIGIHGYFPIKMIRSLIGEPTGTSLRFATAASSSIKEWAERNGQSPELSLISLEGEGKVAKRLEVLHEQLEGHMSQVVGADFIFVACHSQGAPVAIQLVAKMISEGRVDHAKIVILCMASVSLGPFPALQSSLVVRAYNQLDTEAAQELFVSTSKASRRYREALRVCLAHSAKIVFAGSMDDQFIPLYSSTFTSISHPHIFRLVFLNGRHHLPDFMAHLLAFALKVRNLGATDHHLIEELSVPLTGSFFSGEGHSKLYDETGIYDTAVRFALETASSPTRGLSEKQFSLTATNPYHLPWALRGLLDEPIVKEKLQSEVDALRKQYDEWTPSSKSMKDVKYRLSGIQLRL